MNNIMTSSMGLAEISNDDSIKKSDDVAMEIISDRETDYNVARDNIHSLLEKGMAALDEMIDTANQAKNARDYEVIATMIKTLTDTSKELVTISEKKADKTVLQKEEGKVVTNNLFVGSTSELQKMLKDMRDA